MNNTTVELTKYRQEVYDYLSSLTVKFEYFAALENREQDKRRLLVNYRDKTTWSYYQNLVGQYHPSNIPMYVTSLDDGSEILFDRTIEKTHPITFKAYAPGKELHRVLITRYPRQGNLAKSIVFPVESIEKAIDSRDYTVFYSNKNILHPNERDDMEVFVQDMLYFIYDRYYVEQMYYEELYPLAFWSLTWCLLVEAMFCKRLMNIHTQEVHPYHIWEYITSHGLQNYSHVLNNKQSLWLYRNLKYLIANSGTNKTLRLLAENLLSPTKTTLVGKNIVHTTDKSRVGDRASWYAEVDDELIINFSDDESKQTKKNVKDSIYGLHSRLVDLGYETKNTSRYVKHLQDSFNSSAYGTLATKCIEMNKEDSSSEYSELLLKFATDTLIHRYLNNKIDFTISFRDSDITISKLDIGSVLALLYYCAHRVQNVTPELLPTLYPLKYRYKYFTQTDVANYPKEFYLLGNKNTTATWIVDEFLTKLPTTTEILDHSAFMNHLAEQFDYLLYTIKLLRQDATMIVHKAFESVYDYWCPEEVVQCTLDGTHTTYEEFFSVRLDLKAIIRTLDDSKAADAAYINFGSKLLTVLFPFYRYTSLSPHMRVTSDLTTAYFDGLKNLFKQLSSYDLLYLDTSRSSSKYFDFTKFVTDFTNQPIVGIDVPGPGEGGTSGDEPGSGDTPGGPGSSGWNNNVDKGDAIYLHPDIDYNEAERLYDTIHLSDKLATKVDVLGTQSKDSLFLDDGSGSGLTYNDIDTGTMDITMGTEISMTTVTGTNTDMQYDRTITSLE